MYQNTKQRWEKCSDPYLEVTEAMRAEIISRIDKDNQLAAILRINQSLFMKNDECWSETTLPAVEISKQYIVHYEMN